MEDAAETAACERAKTIIEICGGFDVVARVVGRAKQRVHSWTYPRDRHGTGGMIPPACQLQLLQYSRSEGLGLTPAHFFPPADDNAEQERGAA